MAKCYPPIVEKTIAPFFGSNITVPYTLNRAVGFNEISGFRLLIKSTVTNEVIVKEQTDVVTSGRANFYIQDTSQLFAGGFYKIQIAFIDNKQEVGYYSPVTIAKYLGKKPPLIDVIDKTMEDDTFVGVYNPQEDITEKMYSYCFTLEDNNGKVIETTGERLHNSTKDTGLEQIETFVPKISLDSGSNYTIRFSITTINGLPLQTSKVITAKKDDSGYKPRNIRLSATMDEENGYMNLRIYSEDSANTRQLIYGKFVIYKTSSKDNFKEKYKIAYFSLENQDIFEKTFKDFTVEAGYSYRYILQQVNDYGIYSEEIYSDGEPIKANYEHLFLFDGIRQLKIKYNPKVSSFRNTILESKIDTIGSKYPFIFRNNTVKYKELALSGLISYQMDEQNLFLNDSDIWADIGEGISAKDKWTHNLTYDSITAERAFKLKVLDWLNNGEVKLFKSPTEGNYIVRLLNVSLTPVDTVGRMLHSFNATGYEVENIEEYQFCQAITIDKTNRYVGYRTTPLYEFPKFRLYNNGLNIDNTDYEIIGSPNLEFVTGVRFEDVKPRTRFNVLLERKGQTYNHSFIIGATGFYAIPSELGFHIKQIRLDKSSWEIGDYSYDIINNRGQVTYEFERQAKHNNFNDITKIQSDILFAQPLYSKKMTVEIEEPLTNIEGLPIYHYVIVSDEPGLIEVAYFKDQENPMIRGVDYDVTEEGEYQTIGDSPTSLTLDTTKGYKFHRGEQIPKFMLSDNPNEKTYQVITGLPTGEKTVYFKAGDNSTIKRENPEGAVLFLPVYNSKGVQEFDHTVTEEEELVNPYHSYCGTNTISAGSIETIQQNIYVNIYQLQPLISVTSGGEVKSSKLGTQLIYKNFVPNKYYNVMNLDGEYYIKEEIQNLYKIDFELIQVFYNETTPEENFEITGKVSYEDVSENLGYSRTIRRLSGIQENKIDKLTDEEMYYDTVTLRQPDFPDINPETVKEKSFLSVLEFIGQFNSLKDLYDGLEYDEGTDDQNAFLTKNWDKLTLYTQETYTNGVYGYEKVDKTKVTGPDSEEEYFVNPRIQAYDRYIERTTPGYNEIIIVFTDNPNHIIKIDLTQRFSYTLDADSLGQVDLQNIDGIYIGQNVRGFVTYKSKRYSYRAILDNGLSVDLEPDKKNIREG